MNTKLLSPFILVLVTLLLPLGLPGAALTDAQQAWLKRANRHEKHGWIYLHIEGGARERGFQYGHLLAKEIIEGIRRNRVAWEYQSAMDWAWLLEKADALFTLTQFDWMRGILESRPSQPWTKFRAGEK